MLLVQGGNGRGVQFGFDPCQEEFVTSFWVVFLIAVDVATSARAMPAHRGGNNPEVGKWIFFHFFPTFSA